MNPFEIIAANPFAFGWLALVVAIVGGVFTFLLMEYKREIDRRTEADDRAAEVVKQTAERRAAESWRIGTTWRLQYTSRRTEPTWLRTSMQQRRAA